MSRQREKGARLSEHAVHDDGVRYELVTETDADDPIESPIRLLRRVFRGRYRIACAMAALFAVLGGVTGYSVLRPRYASTGLVSIEGALPAILFSTEESRVPPNFDAYVAAQVTHLQSRQVLDAAVNRPEMAHAGWPEGTQGIADLQRALSVRRVRGEQVISVTVTHRQPRLAHAAVNAVLAVFDDSHADPGGLSFQAKERALVERRRDLEQTLDELKIRMLDASDQYGRDAVVRLHAAKVDELTAVDQKLTELRLARTRLAAGEAATVPGGEDSTADTRLAALRVQELALLADIRSSRYRPGHPILRELTRQLEALRIQIDQLEGDGQPQDAATAGGAAASSAVARLDEMAARYDAMRREIRVEAARLGRQLINLESLEERVTEVKQRLAQTRRRLDELRFEAGRDNLDRVTISPGGLPVAPLSDRRRSLAAVGVLFGVAAGAGLVFLIGICDRRVRFLEELEMLDLPGPVIAELGPGGDGVRQLRSVLELKGRPGRNVYAVSSCGHGEGKTRLSMALSASFAESGRRVLVIDANTAGAGLTRRLGMAGLAGLTEAVDTGGADGRIHETRCRGLWLMPAGLGSGSRPLSADVMSRLLVELRSRFDVIIIDTGALVDDAEAYLVSAVADAVILVVARDQNRDLVQTSLERLSQVGASCVGAVFNRHEAGARRRAAPAPTPVAPPSDVDLGPLARLGAEDDRASGHGRRAA